MSGGAVGPSTPASVERFASIEQVLPDAAAVSDTVGSPIVTMETATGVLDVLYPGTTGTSPTECIGAMNGGMRQTYRDAPVSSAVTAWWQTSLGIQPLSNKSMHVDVAVVQVDSSEGAYGWFTRFATQWARCQGTSITHVAPQGDTDDASHWQVNHVADTNGMLSAAALMTTGSNCRVDPLVTQRALTTAADYLVDVDVDVIAIDGDAAPVNASDQAIAVAHLIADRIVSTG